MLHVRVVSPATVTGQLAGTLATAAGVQNVVVQAGGARRPDGDAVQFDVRDEAANPVLGALRDLGLDRSGVICVERVDAALTGQPPVAADRGALRRETAPIWEMVETTIRGGQSRGQRRSPEKKPRAAQTAETLHPGPAAQRIAVAQNALMRTVCTVIELESSAAPRRAFALGQATFALSEVPPAGPTAPVTSCSA